MKNIKSPLALTAGTSIIFENTSIMSGKISLKTNITYIIVGASALMMIIALDAIISSKDLILSKKYLEKFL